MLGAVAAGAACGGGHSLGEDGFSRQGRSRAEREYLLLRSELAAAARDSVYLVLDFPRRETALKLKGARLWSCPMPPPGAGHDKTAEFAGRFMGERPTLLRRVEWKHRFAAKERIPAHTLDIVAKAISAEPSTLQRLVPERLLICLRDRVFVDIRTDVEGRPTGGLGNPSKSMERALGVMLGGVSLDLTMEGETALSLYEAMYPGMPVLMVPP